MKLLLAFVFFFAIEYLSSWTVSASSNFNVFDYGAIGNGQADDSQAFLKAWTAACGATGGTPTLYAPEGKIYMLQPLTFEGPCKSNQLIFQLGGTLMAPKGKAAWPRGSDRWITFSDIDGLLINGRGQFDAQGSSWWKDCKNHCQRPTALFIHNCNGFQLSETKHINSGKNHISINGCYNAIISNIRIVAPGHSPNTDGIDISSSNSVLIQNSYIGTGDDCIAINNGTSNINIVGVTCGPGHGISVGSLGKDGEYNVVENIHVRNCSISGTQNGVRIKTWQGGSGYARNISFEDIKLTNAQNSIIIDQYYNNQVYATKIKNFVQVYDVSYREIHGTSVDEKAIIFNCSPGGCRSIIMENISIQSSNPSKKAKAICQNIQGRSTSTIPTVPCLSNSYL